MVDSAIASRRKRKLGNGRNKENNRDNTYPGPWFIRRHFNGRGALDLNARIIATVPDLLASLAALLPLATEAVETRKASDDLQDNDIEAAREVIAETQAVLPPTR